MCPSGSRCLSKCPLLCCGLETFLVSELGHRKSALWRFLLQTTEAVIIQKGYSEFFAFYHISHILFSILVC